MANINELSIVSYNMHGFFQGIEVVKSLSSHSRSPDIMLLQEHWLTPAKLYLFRDHVTSYFAFGKSAMSDSVTSGPLVGRPYGGAIVLIKNELRTVTECIVCADRFAIVKVGNLIIVSLYLPCTGTNQRMCIIEDALQDIWSWRLNYPECRVIIGGDFNCDLSQRNDVSSYIRSFLEDRSLRRCDVGFQDQSRSTYVNESLDHSSVIDYFVCNAVDSILDYSVLDPDINFSDHLPISICCKLTHPVLVVTKSIKQQKVKQLRWDHADLLSYYNTTRNVLYPLYYEILEFNAHLSESLSADRQHFIDCYYSKVVEALKYSAELHVPLHYKNYYKFWWSEHLTYLKEKAIKSNKMWKEAGRPRSGPIADMRNSEKRNYKNTLYRERQAETQSYTNDLHEALINKSGVNFWKCWNSKFEKANNSSKFIDGLGDDEQIAEAFAEHFRKTCTSFNDSQNSRLRLDYLKMRLDYVGDPPLNSYKVDAELIESVLLKMARGKAAGLDELTVEHILFSHPVLVSMLVELINLIMFASHVPYGFRLSYTVPLSKDETGCKRNSVDNYRAISISPVISKLFEHCILMRYSEFLGSSPNQFGFKKRSSCGHAIYSVRKIVDQYVNSGSTVNLCSLDLSKAFDKMNHYALFIKLMNRSIPVQVLSVLEDWLSLCLSCVKWGSAMSRFYELKTGVRQGGVLSPILFGIFIDDIVTLVSKAGTGCKIGASCAAIFLYADDIILLSPSVFALQTLVNVCALELQYLDMAVNAGKSACMRFGPRSKSACTDIVVGGTSINWVTSARYLGVYLETSVRFRCSFAMNKAKFFKAFNNIFGKIGRNSSEEVLFTLIKTKCLPILFYGTEACPINSSIKQSLTFTMNRLIFKIFGAMPKDCYNYVYECFGIDTAETTIQKRQEKFLKRYGASDNPLCRLIFEQQ